MVDALKGMKDMDKTAKKLQGQRKDLPKKDGQTKKRVDEWNQNLKAFTNKNKDQVDLLERIQNGGEGKGGSGNSNTRDYFGLIVARMAKDIEDLLRICQQVLTLNIKKPIASKEQNDQDWAIARQTIRNEAIKALTLSQDPNANKL